MSSDAVIKFEVHEVSDRVVEGLIRYVYDFPSHGPNEGKFSFSICHDHAYRAIEIMICIVKSQTGKIGGPGCGTFAASYVYKVTQISTSQALNIPLCY